MRDVRFPPASRLAGFGTTIFTEMSALAERTGSINLGQGFPDEDGPSAVLEAAVAGDPRRPQPVRAAAGRARAARRDRRAPAAPLRARATRGEVQVTFGATEAITAALLGLCEPGDEVVALDPFYDSYARGRRRWPARRSRRRRCARRTGASTPSELAAAITPRTRVLLLNSPHNPTGRVLDRAELERDRRGLRRARPDRDHRRGLRAPRVRRRARPARDAAGDGRAHADRVLDRQDVLGHRLEDRLGVRAGRAGGRACAAPSSS